MRGEGVEATAGKGRAAIGVQLRASIESSLAGARRHSPGRTPSVSPLLAIKPLEQVAPHVVRNPISTGRTTVVAWALHHSGLQPAGAGDTQTALHALSLSAAAVHPHPERTRRRKTIFPWLTGALSCRSMRNSTTYQPPIPATSNPPFSRES